MTRFEILNKFFIQLLFIRIYKSVNRETKKVEHYGVLYWVLPFTGWSSSYVVLNKKLKFKPVYHV